MRDTTCETYLHFFKNLSVKKWGKKLFNRPTGKKTKRPKNQSK